MKIDLTNDILKMFERLLMHITLGVDADLLKVDIHAIESDQKGGKSYVQKTMTVSEAVEENW